MRESEASICKAFQGAAIVCLLLQALNNAADGSLRLALRVKINEKIDTIHFIRWGKHSIVTNLINAVYLLTK